MLFPIVAVGSVLALLSSSPASAQPTERRGRYLQNSEFTNVVDALESDDPFDLNLSVGYVRESRTSRIRRESNNVGVSPDAPLKPLTEAKEEFERTYLKNVLQLTGGNISRAAQFAGRYRADFYKMLKKYGLHPSTTKGKPETEIDELEEEAHLTEAEP